MGANFASTLAGEAENIGLRNAIATHFTHNHYPPIPHTLVAVAVDIVDGVKNGVLDMDDSVKLPDGVLYRNEAWAPVRACVDAWHLTPFIWR